MQRRLGLFSHLASDSTTFNYAVAVLVSIGAHFAQWPLSFLIEPTRFLLSFPAVFFASWLGGLWPGLVSVALCSVGAILNSIGHRANTNEFASWVRLFVFILFSVFIVVLNGRSLDARQTIERKRRLLEASEARLKLALKSGHASLFEWTPATGEFWRSEGYDLLFGRGENEWGVADLGFDELIHPDDRDRVRERIESALNGEQSYVVEYRIVWSDHSIHWLHTSGQVERDSDGRALRLSGATVDITERKNLEIQLEAAKEIAERSNRAKTDFVSHMSHELRTPLGVIIGFTDLALDGSAPGSDQHEYLMRVRKSGATLLEIIGNILDLSKVKAKKLLIDRSDVSLTQILKDLAADVSLQVKERNLALSFEISHDVPAMISTDVVRLRQILMNLVGNALKFTEEGSIHIQVLRNPDPSRPRSIEFSVKDTGIGLTEDQRLRLFQDFTQADPSTTRKYGGTGLGLTLSRQLARALGGDLKIEESHPRLGTTFTFTIETGEMTNSAISALKPVDQKLNRELDGLRILLIEDSPDIRLLVNRFLTLAGASVIQAENGQQGVDHAVTAEFDAILMDIQMPVLDGFSAIREMRRREVGTPIIALTAHALIEERQRAFEAGFDDYVTKPIRRDVLIHAVKTCTSTQAGRPGSVDHSS